MTSKCAATGNRHKWTWVRNLTATYSTNFGQQVRFTLRGMYACQCGQKKYGLPKPNA